MPFAQPFPIDILTTLSPDQLANSPTDPLSAEMLKDCFGTTYIIIREQDDDMSLKDRLESTHSLTSALTDDANPVINYGACLAGNYTILRQEEDNSWLVVDPASLILIGYRLIEDQRTLEYLWNGIRQIREDLSSIKRLARGEDR